MNLQCGVENACQDDPQDALQGTFHGEIGVGLLKPALLDDVREEGACRRVENAADCIAQDSENKENKDVGMGLGIIKHENGGQDDQASLHKVADVHDPGFAFSVAEHSSNRGEDQHRGTAESQVQPLQEGAVAADLEDVETHSETVQDRSEFGYQRAHKNKPEVPVSENIVILHFLLPHSTAWRIPDHSEG